LQSNPIHESACLIIWGRRLSSSRRTRCQPTLTHYLHPGEISGGAGLRFVTPEPGTQMVPKSQICRPLAMGKQFGDTPRTITDQARAGLEICP
jgi:hypothetical protein